MSLGFKIQEVMSGHHTFDKSWCFNNDWSDGPYFMEFNITWGPKSIKDWLNPFGSTFMKQPLSGFITINGLCQDNPCEGILTLAYHKGEICYDINFIFNGQRYNYIGKKTGIRPWNLPVSHTTCNGTLTIKGSLGERIVSRSTLFFNFSTLVDFLKSFRFTYE